MDFQQQLQQVAKSYEDEGYTVVIAPQPGQLPPFAAGYEVHLLAAKGDQGVLVAVERNRKEFAAKPAIRDLADVTNRQPGWRFDLVILEAEPAEVRSLQGATEPTPEQIDQRLREAEELLKAGTTTAACVVAWGAFEAAMRRVVHEGYGAMPNVLLRRLYASGYISREDFSLLDEGHKVSTQVVHGFVPARLDERLVTETLRAARHLLGQDQQPEPAAG